MSLGTRRSGQAELRLRQLGVHLPDPPTPFGSYVEAVQVGNLLFLSGMIPVLDHKPKYVGRLGCEIDLAAGTDAARIAALGALAAAKHHLGSLDRVIRVVRHTVFVATDVSFTEHPKVADGASDLFRDVFGADKMSTRSVVGVQSLPLGVPVEIEIILEVE